MASPLKATVFSGIRPRLSESLLPEHAATIAENCDFAYGELRNIKDGYPLSSTTNVPKSIYTDDGLTFYTWEREVDSVRAPMVNDSFKRLYYTDGTAFRVTARDGTRLNGGEPSNSYKVGVPRPTVPPVLAIPALPDLGTAKLEWFFHYESAGIKYQEQSITPTVIVENDSYKYVPPEMLTGAAIEPFTYKAAKYTKTYTNPAWLSNPTYNQQFLTTEYTLPANSYIKVLNANTIQVKEPTRTYSETGVAYFKDEDGLSHEVESIFTMQKYGFVKDQTVQISTKTPIGSAPVFRLKATNKEDGAPLFDIYTSNSAFSDSAMLWRLLASKSSTNGEYTITIDRGIPEKDKETRAYVYAYVNIYGEEGPPSDAATVTTSPVIDVSATVVRDSIVGYAPIKGIRLYRTPSGSTVADFFFVTEIPVLTGGPKYTFIDNLKGAELNENLSSDYFYPPPDNLIGLMTLPNGILCAWKDNELWFSEAYKPWAWPPSYVKTLANKIVGGIVHGSGAVITTTGKPYLVSGISPDSMTTSQLNVPQAGLSRWSIASVDGSVVYASNDGLVTLVGAQASLSQSAVFFTRDVFRKRYSDGFASMRFSVWDGRLVVFSSENKFVPFMIRLDEADGTMTDLPNLKATCAFISLLSDQFYYTYGTWIYQFNAGADLPAVWQSRELVIPSPDNYGYAQAVVGAGSWQIDIYADAELRHSETVEVGTTEFRLPAGFLSDRWKFKITGKGRMRELRIAKTARDLKNG